MDFDLMITNICMVCFFYRYFLIRGASGPMGTIRILAHNQKVVSSNHVKAVTCFPRLPRGTLNRGAVCVRMHLRSCMDLKEPG